MLRCHQGQIDTRIDSKDTLVNNGEPRSRVTRRQRGERHPSISHLLCRARGTYGLLCSRFIDLPVDVAQLQFPRSESAAV